MLAIVFVILLVTLFEINPPIFPKVPLRLFVISQTDRDFALTEIDYTGNSNTGQQPYNKVEFTYSVLPNVGQGVITALMTGGV